MLSNAASDRIAVTVKEAARLAVRTFRDHDIRLDFSVGVKRSACVPPALSLQFYILVDRKFSSHKKFLCLANTEILRNS